MGAVMRELGLEDLFGHKKLDATIRMMVSQRKILEGFMQEFDQLKADVATLKDLVAQVIEKVNAPPPAQDPPAADVQALDDEVKAANAALTAALAPPAAG